MRTRPNRRRRKRKSFLGWGRWFKCWYIWLTLTTRPNRRRRKRKLFLGWGRWFKCWYIWIQRLTLTTRPNRRRRKSFLGWGRWFKCWYIWIQRLTSTTRPNQPWVNVGSAEPDVTVEASNHLCSMASAIKCLITFFILANVAANSKLFVSGKSIILDIATMTF